MKKAKEEEIELSEEEKDDLALKMMSSLDGFNSDATMLADAQSNIENFDDSGCYILNALLSGSLKGGFAEGRVNMLSAPSSVGKSFIALQAAGIAQKKGKFVVVFDSENSIDASFASSLGVDINKCKYYPVTSVENCQNAIFNFLTDVKKNKLKGKFFVIIDSLGAMISEQDIKRFEDDNVSPDMGTFAKAMKKFLKMLTNLAGATRTTIVCTNHVYDNPGQLYPTIEKNVYGGKGVAYMPSIHVQLSATKVKESDKKVKVEEEAAKGSKGMSGIAVRGLSIKNRVCKPFVEANMFISWSNGMLKYYGLLDLAVEFGLLRNSMNRYYVQKEDGTEEFVGNAEKLNYDGEFWEKFMPTLQKALDDNWKYTIHV